MLKQIEVTQDAVEVYYYCMLLGFKGRYAIYEQEKLLAIMQETANALVKVGKIKPVELSPHWLANDQPKPPEKRGMPIWAKLGALGGVGLAIIVYGILFMLSFKFLNDTVEKLPL
jgi:type IV/VI secretion system ImpK/VasF family protein